ncbi:MAG: hypothetical protein ACYTDU_05245 [Planctomycetota bacterium]|jgi:hypothetical protein
MRKTLILVLAALAAAQSPGSKGKQTMAEKLRLRGFAGPGFVQKDFVGGLGGHLKEGLGARRADKMIERLGSHDLSARDVLRLQNGETTKSQVRTVFGANRGEIKGVLQALDRTVIDKDRKLFFGIVIMTMVFDFKIDATSDFCRQVAMTCTLMDGDQTAKLLSGNVSRNTVKEIFGFRAKADQREMQRILNRAWDSVYLTHPLADSITRRAGRPKRRYEARRYPTLRRGMPGHGGEYASGKAGGLPFDTEMPPCPFFGSNLEDFFDIKKK